MAIRWASDKLLSAVQRKKAVKPPSDQLRVGTVASVRFTNGRVYLAEVLAFGMCNPTR